MTKEWEYEEEAIAAERERESQERFKRMPILCQRCRWLDWYYFEECTHHLWPKNDRCSMFCRDYKFIFNQRIPSRLRLWWWAIQYHLWELFRRFAK